MSLGGNVLELYAKLGLDSSEYEKGLEGAKGKANGFASFLGTVGKVGVAAFTAVGTATVAMGKQAFDAYANYEQLAGGIEKLFGEEGAKIVAQYAEQAFLTSGKSINEYYNSVSQITASLKRSIGDDMNEVARVADVAMQVISDNVNTFGSDASFVESAIMGLSRQNYTMLDNLKLGYAGTAQGMLELINDSGILGKTLKDTSELANVGFDQMILAIEEVQKQQGIWGTTANEALHTIEGAAKATKSAWQNVITAIGRGEGIDEALSGLATALFGDDTEESGLLAQFTERIPKVMKGIGEFVVQSAPLIAGRIPETLGSILPSVWNTTTQLFSMLVSYIMQNVPQMFDSGMEALNKFIDGMSDKMPDIMEFIIDMMSNIVEWIIGKLPSIVETAAKIVGSLVRGLLANWPKIITTLFDLGTQALKTVLTIDWLSLGRDIVGGIVDGIKRFGGSIGETLSNMASSAWKSVKNFFGIKSPSKLMRDTVGKFIPLGMAEGIEDEADSVYSAMESLGKGLLDSYDVDFSKVKPKGLDEIVGGTNYGGVTINVYPSQGMDENLLAEKVMRKINSSLRKEKAIYG